MTLFLDPRAGSGDLYPLLEPRIHTVLQQMEYGDAKVSAHWSGGDVSVGVEIKRLGDLLQSLLDQRFTGHQLPGLLAAYPVVYLVVEGEWRQGPESRIEYRKFVKWIGGGKDLWVDARTRLTWSALDRWLMTLENKCGIRVRRTNSRTETAQFLVDLHAWSSKPWAAHAAHLAFDPQLHLSPRRTLLIKPGMVGRMAKELPGVGWVKHKAVLRKLPTVAAMVEATVAEWQTIEGIGKVMAERIHRALRTKC